MRHIKDKDNNKDEAKIMAGLLRSGYTMLNLGCPVCNNPLFRKKNDDIFCPICNKKVIIKKEEAVSTNSKDAGKSAHNKQDISRNEIEFKFNFNYLLGILEKKIDLISQKLEQETQIDLIEKYIKLLIKIYDFFNNLKNSSASAGI